MLLTLIVRTRAFAYSCCRITSTFIRSRQPLHLPHRKPETKPQKRDRNQCPERRQGFPVRFRPRRTTFRQTLVGCEGRADHLPPTLACAFIRRRSGDRWIENCPLVRRVARQV